MSCSDNRLRKFLALVLRHRPNEIALRLEPVPPPSTLFHGTAERSVERILSEGLKPGSRRHVHLSTGRVDARRVGARHGNPRILRVVADRMHRQGHRFYRAAEGGWLAARVPSDFLDLLDD